MIDQLDSFVDFVVADKPLPVYARYELESSVAASLTDVPEPATLDAVRSKLGDVLDDVSMYVGLTYSRTGWSNSGGAARARRFGIDTS